MNSRVRKLSLYVVVLLMAVSQLFFSNDRVKATTEYGADGTPVTSLNVKTEGMLAGATEENVEITKPDGPDVGLDGTEGIEGIEVIETIPTGPVIPESYDGAVVTVISQSLSTGNQVDPGYFLDLIAVSQDPSTESPEGAETNEGTGNPEGTGTSEGSDNSEGTEPGNQEENQTEDTATAGSFMEPVYVGLTTKNNASEYLNKIVCDVDPYLGVYKNPDKDSGLMGKLFEASYADILERGEEWTKVKSGNVVGYIQNKYVCFDDEAEDLANELKGTLSTGMTIQEEKKAKEEAARKKAAAEAAKKMKEQGTANLGATAVSGNDVFLLAAIIDWEAGNESADGRRAVGYVVLNRLKSGRWGNSITSVLTAPGQFGGVSDGGGGFSSRFYERYLKYANGTSNDCLQAAYDCIAGRNCPLQGAFLSFNTRLSGAATFYQQIGNHFFW